MNKTPWTLVKYLKFFGNFFRAHTSVLAESALLYKRLHMIDFNKIDLFIFDLDGTLIDSAKDLAVCLDLALQEEGLKRHTMDELLARISVGSKTLLRELVNDDPHAERRVFETYIKLYAEKMFDHTILYPNVIEVLELLKNKKVALLSNKREAPCKTILKHFKIDHHFKIVLGGDSLSQKNQAQNLFFIFANSLM